MNSLLQLWLDILRLRGMPALTVNLWLSETEGNDPFYADMVREYYAYTRKRHPRFPLICHDRYGVALLRIPEKFDHYFMSIEGSARRNYRKAERLGYRFDCLDHNRYIEDIRAIWQSTDVRQGRVPEHIAEGKVTPATHPPSRNPLHDYRYFGVFKDGHVVAYAGCMISGELCAIEHIYGHAAHQRNGVVPMLIINIVSHLVERCPSVKVLTYDTFLGASETLRRFKKKFGFVPHKVRWALG